MSTITNTAVRAAAAAAKAEAEGKRLATVEQMKTWGRENGYKVPEAQGRPSKALIEAYNGDTRNKRARRVYVSGAAPAAPTRFTFTTAAGRESTFEAVTEDVREWARGQEGLTVGDRGRLSRAVVDAYGQAHAKPRKARKAKAKTSE